MAQNQSEPTNMHDALDASTCGNVAISDQLAQTIIDEMLSSVILKDLNQNSTELDEVEELTDEYLTTASNTVRIMTDE